VPILVKYYQNQANGIWSLIIARLKKSIWRYENSTNIFRLMKR